MSDCATSLLLTDFYEITMAAAFLENNFNPTASFELFVRRLPKNRGYLIAAGLEQVLAWLERAHFSEEDISFLRKHPAFRHVSDGFFEHLRGLRFTGDIWAVPEGTVVFAEEPILRVTAPLVEAQLIETYLLAAVTFQTMIATKASRVVAAAQGCDHRVRRPSCAWAGGGKPRGTCQLYRRLCWHFQRRSGTTVCHSHVRYDGAFVCDGVKG
jgi:putative nicotinate phosphoribosyltransferase